MKGHKMQQFEYQLTNRRTGRVEHKRATAATAEIARAQIVLMYGPHFDVAAAPGDVYAPHYILGEINCADFPRDELHLMWLLREAAAVEATA
jgi:hypothetical protein